MSERSRVRWRCRRGMKELDVLLERFFAAEYDTLDDAEKAAFAGLLEREDPELFALIMARAEPASAAEAELLDRIRRFDPPVSR